MRSFTPEANFINHFFLDIDASGSMNRHMSAVIRVVDDYVKFLASLSQQQDQETRLTVYTFSDRGQEKCLFYDKDVLRMPSIAGLYRPGGQTALIDCALKSIAELQQTATLYGSHSFMGTVVSDGIENASIARAHQLATRIAGLPDNWTTAAFGPDAMAVSRLKACGFPASNVDTWNTMSASGIEEVGSKLQVAAENLVTGRKYGIHGYNSASVRGATGGNLFALRDFSVSEVKQELVALTEGSYYFLDVDKTVEIAHFFHNTGHVYPVGKCYYQWMKPETVQANKLIAVELTEGSTKRVYTGAEARKLLGLPEGMSVKLRPGHKEGCTIFVQSGSHNRHLIPGTRLLVMR